MLTKQKEKEYIDILEAKSETEQSVKDRTRANQSHTEPE